jgi:hypothetical protein
VDLDAVATMLGLGVLDARLKVGFPAPEVLLASDRHRADEFADSLRGAGLNVAVVDGADLTTIPWPAPVGGFDFRAEGLAARIGDGVVELGYDEPVLGVYCKPPSDLPGGVPIPDGAVASGDAAAASEAGAGPAGKGLEIAEALEWTSILDLYFARDGRLRRISVVGDITDFGGLGDMRHATGAENVATTVAECTRLFRRIEIDARLEGVRPRTRFVGGDAGFDLDLRKLYSFGTLLLRQVLDSISPELRDLTQFELGSRLAYVVRRRALEQAGPV